MASFEKGSNEPKQAPGVNKTQVFEDIKAVLERHYNWYLVNAYCPQALTAWSIMQDVRERLGLSVDETES